MCKMQMTQLDMSTLCSCCSSKSWQDVHCSACVWLVIIYRISPYRIVHMSYSGRAIRHGFGSFYRRSYREAYPPLYELRLETNHYLFQWIYCRKRWKLLPLFPIMCLFSVAVVKSQQNFIQSVEVFSTNRLVFISPIRRCAPLRLNTERLMYSHSVSNGIVSMHLTTGVCLRAKNAHVNRS